MKGPIRVTFAAKRFAAKTICEIIAISTLKRNRSNVPSAEKVFVNPALLLCIKSYIWKNRLINVRFVGVALTSAPISKRICLRIPITNRTSVTNAKRFFDAIVILGVTN